MAGIRQQSQYITQYITEIAENSLPDLSAYLVKVKSFDGQLVTVIPMSGDVQESSWEGIPVSQSKYFKPIVMPGDIGIMINLHTNIYSALKEQSPYFTKSGSYLYLPLVTKSQVIDASNDKLVIQSPAENSSVKLDDTQIDIQSNSINIKSQGPISIGANENLGALLGELLDILSTLTTIPTVPGSPATLDVGVIAKLTQLKTKIAGNFS